MKKIQILVARGLTSYKKRYKFQLSVIYGQLKLIPFLGTPGVIRNLLLPGLDYYEGEKGFFLPFGIAFDGFEDLFIHIGEG